MDTEQLIQRDSAILQKAQGLGANPGFLLVFGVAMAMALAGGISVFASGLWGFVILAALAAGGAVNAFTSIGDKAMIITLVLVSALVGLGTLAITTYIWMGMGAGA